MLIFKNYKVNCIFRYQYIIYQLPSMFKFVSVPTQRKVFIKIVKTIINITENINLIYIYLDFKLKICLYLTIVEITIYIRL